MRFSAGVIAAADIRPENYGVIDGSNDAAYIQQAIDAAEGGKTVYFDSTKTYKIKSTVYIGSVNLQTNGATLRIEDTGSFAQTGAAARRTEGAIITKSAENAGYGYSTVAVSADQLNLVFVKSATSSIRGPLILENTSSFVCPVLSIDADNSSGDSCNSLDFYQGVQGVDIETLTIDLDTGASTIQGGFWIRNKSAARDTKNIDIATLNITHRGTDESFAIFNDTNNGDVNNVHLHTVSVTIPSGGRGLVGSIYNAGTYSAAMFQSIVIDSLTATVGGFNNTPFIWKTQACAPTISTISIHHTGADSGSIGTNAFAIRHTAGSGQTAHPQYGTATLTMDANISVSSAAYVVDGKADFSSLTVSGTGTGWTDSVHGGGVISSGTLSLIPTAFQIDGADSFVGTASGKFGIRDCLSFVGTLGLDTASFTGIAFLVQSTAVPITNIVFDATINLTGASALARIFLAQANGGSLTSVPSKVRYVLNNPNNLTITSSDSVSNKCFFNAVDCFMNVNGTITPRNNGGTKTLSTDTISMSVTNYSGAVDTQSGAATDDFSTLSGATIDGQFMVLWMANAGHVVTARDTVGNLNLGSDVVMQASPTSISQTLGLRWNAGTSKWDKTAAGGW